MVIQPPCLKVITYSFICCKRLSAFLSAFAKLCENAIIRLMHLAQNAKNPLFPGFFIHSGQRIFLIFYLFQYIFQFNKKVIHLLHHTLQTLFPDIVSNRKQCLIQKINRPLQFFVLLFCIFPKLLQFFCGSSVNFALRS